VPSREQKIWKGSSRPARGDETFFAWTQPEFAHSEPRWESRLQKCFRKGKNCVRHAPRGGGTVLDGKTCNTSERGGQAACTPRHLAQCQPSRPRKKPWGASQPPKDSAPKKGKKGPILSRHKGVYKKCVRDSLCSLVRGSLVKTPLNGTTLHRSETETGVKTKPGGKGFSWENTTA